MKVERTDTKTVVLDDVGNELGHVLKSGMRWVVKDHAKPIVGSEKSRLMAELALGRSLGFNLEQNEVRRGPQPKGS